MRLFFYDFKQTLIMGYIQADTKKRAREVIMGTYGLMLSQPLLKDKKLRIKKVASSNDPNDPTYIIAPPSPTHRHIKRGTDYARVVDDAHLQFAGAINEDTPLTIYIAEEDGSYCVRPTAEFNDGRFKEIAS